MDERTATRAARRPLLACALALLAGSLLGAGSGASSGVWALGAAAAAGFCLGARHPDPRRGRLVAGLVLLALLQALRATVATTDSPGAGWTPRAVEGRWVPLAASSDAARGRIVGAGRATPVFELSRGLVREGERVRLSPTRGPAAAARGPVPSPRTHTGSVGVHPDEIERLSASIRGLPAMRIGLAARCDRLGGETAALARALLLGDRSRLDSATADRFTRTGVRHLLAVSGLHVGLFAALLAGPAAWALVRLLPGTCASRRDVARTLAVLGLMVYAPLAGGAPPVRRATIAAAVALLAPLVPAGGGSRSGRAVDGLSAWSAALSLELVADPLAAVAVGVQLSYAATLGLICCVRPLARALRDCVPRHPPALTPSSLGLWRRAIIARAGRGVALALAASGAATLATLPIVWSRFGAWSPIGVVLTPIALVLLACLLPAGWLSLLAPDSLGQALFAPLARSLMGLVHLADGLPGTPCPLPERPGVVLALAGLAALVALACPRRRAASRWVRLAALAWSLVLLPWHPSPSGLELVALDVGHGTAVALRAPGAGVWVFDAGSRDRPGVGPDALGPLLARWDPGRVAVVLSHDQRDHASGLPWLVERWSPWLWAGALPAPLSERLPHTALRLDATQGRLELPAGPTPGELRLALLRGEEGSGNEGSRSLFVAWEGHRALLSGDAEQEGLRALIAGSALPGPLDVLLLPHHGSHTRWLGPLLEATRPGEVWISVVGEPPVAPELTRRGLGWRSTGREGPLVARWPPGPRIESAGTRIAAPEVEPETLRFPGRGIDPGSRGASAADGAAGGRNRGRNPVRPPAPGPGPGSPARGAPLPADLHRGQPDDSNSSPEDAAGRRRPDLRPDPLRLGP